MKRYFVFFVVFGLLLAAVSCSGDKGGADSGKMTQSAGFQSSTASGPVFRTVSPQEAQSLMAQRKDLLVIDVRGPEELREGFIAGSKLVPFWEIARGEQTLPADHPLLLVCAVGGRSYAVGQYLNQKGYREVYNLQGGIDNWKRNGMPLQYP